MTISGGIAAYVESTSLVNMACQYVNVAILGVGFKDTVVSSCIYDSRPEKPIEMGLLQPVSLPFDRVGTVLLNAMCISCLQQ